MLRDHGFGAVVSSDLIRARQSADMLAAGLGLPAPEVDADLRERDIGAWTGCTTAEILERWPGQLEAWRDGKLTAPPGGESHARLVERVTRAVERLAGADTGTADRASALVVVTHGGVIRTLERHLGVEPVTAANFGGRWIEREGEVLRPGPRPRPPRSEGGPLGRQPAVSVGLVHARRRHHPHLLAPRRLSRLGARLRPHARAGAPRGPPPRPPLLGAGGALSPQRAGPWLPAGQGDRGDRLSLPYRGWGAALAAARHAASCSPSSLLGGP